MEEMQDNGSNVDASYVLASSKTRGGQVSEVERNIKERGMGRLGGVSLPGFTSRQSCSPSLNPQYGCGDEGVAHSGVEMQFVSDRHVTPR